MHKKNSTRTLESLEPRILLSGSPGEIDWKYRGSGGGGALFAPSISPHDEQLVYISSDMGQLFESNNGGDHWETNNFRQIQGSLQTRVEFTDDPSILYGISAMDGYDISHPMKSENSGATWERLRSDRTQGEVHDLHADPNDTELLLMTNYDTLYVSDDGGRSFARSYEARTPGGVHIGGVFFDGDDIYVGTNDGLLVSNDAGESFEVSDALGIPESHGILSLGGGKANGTVRLFALVFPVDDIWAQIHLAVDYWGEPCTEARAYVLDVAAGEWQPSMPCDFTADEEGNLVFPFFLDMASDQIDTAYMAGGSTALTPTVYKTTDGGQSWESVLLIDQNENIRTAWAGDLGDRQWTYGASILGLDVAEHDSNNVVITDLGFAYRTTDGGIGWDALTVAPDDRNRANRTTPKGKAYAGTGLDNTTSWGVAWTSPDDMIVFNSDIRGQISEDGGQRFSFDYFGHDRNSLYWLDQDSDTGVVYAATGTVHDLYQSTHLTDAEVDPPDRKERGEIYDGAVLMSANGGKDWQTVKTFDGSVIWTTLDPTRPNRLYASVLETRDGQPAGAIWVTDNLDQGSQSTWDPLSAPPDTEGRPFNIRVLDDGSIVASYSGRRAAEGAQERFRPSSGVFLSTDGGLSWSARSHPNMKYWTKDVVIDPHDQQQNTWYAGVWSGWGSGGSSDQGGLYRTTDRGLTWSRIYSDSDRVSSITIHPENADLAHITTEREGLLFATNLQDENPTFEPDLNYPFRQPERVFYNPHRVNEFWVTSFGGGLRTGQLLLEPVLRADVDLNGMVDFADFLLLSANFGTQSDVGDINDDDFVDFADFLILSGEFGLRV